MSIAKQRYEISFTMQIKKADTYGAAIEHVQVTEYVGIDDDPVQALKGAINREFRRKFAALELSTEEGAID